MSVSHLNQIGHSYLLSRSNICNGGIIAQILANVRLDNVTNSLQSTLTTESYVGRFFFQSSTKVPSLNNSSLSYVRVPVNNLTTTIIGCIYAIVAVLSCLVTGLLWIFYRETKYHPLFQKYYDRVRFQTEKKRFCQDKVFINFNFFSNLQIKKQRMTQFNRIFCHCIFCSVLLIMFIICFVFVSTLQSNLTKQIMGDNNHSFSVSLQQSTEHIERFLDKVTDESHLMFNQTLDNISVSVKSLIFGSLNNLTNQLFFKFGVTDIFTNATKLIQNLEETAQSMAYIKDQSGSLSKKINIQTGSLEANVRQLGFFMENVCSELAQRNDCIQFLRESALLKIAINTSVINDHSSINLAFLLTQFQLNLTELASRIVMLESSLKSKIAAQTQKKVDEINIDQSIDGIRPLWSHISNAVNPLKSKVVILNSSVKSSVKKYGDVFLITTAILLVVVVLLGIAYVVTLGRFTLLYYLERQIVSDLINSPKYKPVSILHHYRKKTIIHNLRNYYKFGDYLVYSYIILFSTVTVVVVTLSLLMINVSHIIYNEVCIQILRPECLSITDGVLDIFLDRYWSYFNQLIVSKDSPMRVKLSQPRKVLSSIINNCTGNLGLLHVLGMTDFVNVSSLIWTQETVKAIEAGLNLTYEAVVQANINSMIPSDMTSFIKISRNIGKYFDEINYQPSIDELNKSIIMLPNYSHWINKSLQYFSSVSTPHSVDVLYGLTILSLKIPEFQQLDNEIKKLREKFLLIQEKRNNSAYIQGMLSSLDRIEMMTKDSPVSYAEVKALYKTIMLQQFPVNVDKALSELLSSLQRVIFPCQSLRFAVTCLGDSLCTSDHTLDTACSYGFNMAAMGACMIVMLHMLWSVIRMEWSDCDEENVSRC